MMTSLSAITWGFLCVFTVALAGLFFTTRIDAAAAKKRKEFRRNKALERFNNPESFDEPIESPEEYAVLREQLGDLAKNSELEQKAVALIKEYEAKLDLMEFIKLHQDLSREKSND
ncbi:hypothetical protein CYQ88_10970 [Hydrogenovibrio sp. SC-1]|uniref:hypothetical protein n=1 Tax=Hydrogenovibrio sp. SC-1 TaxID=2065820 RepID=UPI000C79E57D|nr:hypothetical protein [Hydrogenovibrio sp. SC-1]PLA73474.1 hypothetical protein CYQ88_10970 [Hydrogenovibrio sp. SC-1]